MRNGKMNSLYVHNIQVNKMKEKETQPGTRFCGQREKKIEAIAMKQLEI